MGRIGWADALARLRMGTPDQISHFEKRILLPVQQTLLANTWMTERYTCEGWSTRTSYYHEYPEYYLILKWKFYYGINIEFNRIVINPSSLDPDFNYHIRLGYFEVSFSQIIITIKITGGLYDDTPTKNFEIHKLLKNNNYDISQGSKRVSSKITVPTDSNGILRFTGTIGKNNYIVVKFAV